MTMTPRIPSNTTHGTYNIYICGYVDDSSEGGQISSTFNVKDVPRNKNLDNLEDDFDCSSYEEGIRLLLNANKDTMRNPPYSDIFIRIHFNGNDIEKECQKIINDGLKYKTTMSEKDFNKWVSEYAYSEVCNKIYLYDTIKNLSKEILY